MDNRPDVANNSYNHHQHNIHLHMHHLCTCQTFYPSPYYHHPPPVNYRTPMISYAQAQALARPYLQHYQYTQFNVNNQFGVPLSQLSSLNQNGVQPATPNENIGVGAGANGSNVKHERGGGGGGGGVSRGGGGGAAAGKGEGEQQEFSSPLNEILTDDPAADMNTDNFIKFLERGLLNAEHIAYRNRNRPCFRNIQNLCIRTRTEISKPRATVSNIHSQGIPWATKDFIYAFVRLTNCWHILKGYWENRDGGALGKIEKELTQSFRKCYIRWERETAELATELSRIFYNLDVNQTNLCGGSPTNLVPPTANLHDGPTISAPPVVPPCTTPSKNLIKGLIPGYPPPPPPPLIHPVRTVDQANQTDDDLMNGFTSKKFGGGGVGTGAGAGAGAGITTKRTSGATTTNRPTYASAGNRNTTPKKFIVPREIEFLETAQNVSKNLEAVQDKYWVNPHNNSYANVHEWLSSNNFSENNSSASNSPPKNIILRPSDNYNSFKTTNTATNTWGETITEKSYEQIKKSFQPTKPSTSEGLEDKTGGITKKGKILFEKVLTDLKKTELIAILAEGLVNSPSLDLIERNLIKGYYVYINEIVRDLRQLAKRATIHFKKIGYSNEQIRKIINKIDIVLADYLPDYDFGDITGERDQAVGKLKLKFSAILKERGDN